MVFMKKYRFHIITCVLSCVIYHFSVHNFMYKAGYNDCTHFFQKWLIEEDFANYDKKSGEWRLCTADEIQGSLIKPIDRSNYIDIIDYVHALEDELNLVHKQIAHINNKKTNKSLDFTKPL